MRGLLIFLLAVVAVSALPKPKNRIIGGTVTTIDQYPDMATIIFARGTTFISGCGGTILNNRSILSAAHCTELTVEENVRVRLGSTYANSGGTVYNTALIINHHQFSWDTLDSDICIIRVQGSIVFSNVVQPGFFAGPTFDVPDNSVVWATGWGLISSTGPMSEQLRHVQIYTINQEVCRQRFATIGLSITDNMLCSGVLDVGGRDQCGGDSGGPLYYNGVVIGVCSWGASQGCAHPFFPGVNTRVQRYAGWILQNH